MKIVNIIIEFITRHFFPKSYDEIWGKVCYRCGKHYELCRLHLNPESCKGHEPIKFVDERIM